MDAQAVDTNAALKLTDYKRAQEIIEGLPTTTYDRPDSLKSRDGLLIARFRYHSTWDKIEAIDDWRDTIGRLFPGAVIEKMTIDKKHDVRAYFYFKG